MASPYHQPPLPDDESDDEGNPFDHSYDPNASTDMIPLTQAMPGRRTGNPPYSTSPPVPPYGERPTSRYTLSESYVPPAGQSSSTNLGGAFSTGRVQFPDPSGGRPGSSMSNMTEDWIQRQQPVAVAQADLRRYQTRRVKLNQGNVFTADYPYSSSPIYGCSFKVFQVQSKMPLNQNGETLNPAHWNSHICDVLPLSFSSLIIPDTAATCDPDDFTPERGYTLRQAMYNRQTELLIAITYYNVFPLLQHGLIR